MKKLTCALTLLAGMGFCATTLAASQATLQVKGIINPPACDVAFDGGGILNWDNIDPATLSADKDVQLSAKFTKLNISCSTPSLFAVKSLDVAEGAGEATWQGEKNASLYSLGKTNSGAMIGGYTAYIDLATSQADGEALKSILYSKDNTTWTSIAANKAFAANGDEAYTAGDGTNATPLSLKNLSMSIEVKPWISALDKLGKDEVSLAGNATFDVVYL